MKTTIRIRRRDGVVQRYRVGRTAVRYRLRKRHGDDTSFDRAQRMYDAQEPPWDEEEMEEEEPKKRKWNVGIASPYYRKGLAWTASINFDNLSADALARLDGKDVPIERIEAESQEEAIKKYKKLHPEFKKHFKKMDKEDVELSI